jgi:hypothetical protein
MESIPDGYVTVQIHMPAEMLDGLRDAARRSGASIEEWLTLLLARRAAPEVLRRRPDRATRSGHEDPR